MKQPSEVLGVKIVGGLKETSTPWAGASLLVELFRRSGVEAAPTRVGASQGFEQGAQARPDGGEHGVAERIGWGVH